MDNMIESVVVPGLEGLGLTAAREGDAVVLRFQGQPAAFDVRITAIERQYPAGAPPSVLETYRSLIAQYNSLGANVNNWVAQYNDLLATAKSLAGQLNALPCDPS